jgi:dihydroorotate dehydrogenase (NAD+) catalytic subunit
MSYSQQLPRYRRDLSYRTNYDCAPEIPVGIHVPSVPGTWTYCGLPVDSPLGMPAGPLLNGGWLLYYAALGFDVLTYKTVRSGARECYELPNLVAVDVSTMRGKEDWIPESQEASGSWAVSFGMPSMAPDVWRADIEQTKRRLPRGKVLSVSVVGTIQPNWSIDDLAADYAKCAKWAVEAGADCIETNFSCPNVSTCDGQLYQQPESAAIVAATVRAAIGTTPCVMKIGHTSSEAEASELLNVLNPYVNGVAMTNCIATRVRGLHGELLFDGEQRGICGEATREASLKQLQLFARLAHEKGMPMRMIAVGGAFSAGHVEQYLTAGAESVHIATAAMLDPEVGLRIREELQGSASLKALIPKSKE